MIEAYYDILTKIENFVDGLMIVDENGIIKYNKQFSINLLKFDEKEYIGKTPMEVFTNLSDETSTCYRALKYGETTTNQVQKLIHISGQEVLVLDNTFPVKENGKIIGAVSTSKFIDMPNSNSIDISNMTYTYTDDLFNLKDIIGNSDVISILKHKIHKVSQTNSSVLIYGETGTGKELVAQSIHSHSTRKDGCFISQNCAAIPDTLLESIFFGTTKGSYTGAEDKPGIFELANEGTIFLDEINSMDLNMQAKLLKAIEEKKITRIGGTEAKKVNVRIITAINEPPEKALRENRIRKDLFYRLSSIQIKVPPLRERKEDIGALTEHFIKYYNLEMKCKINGITDEVLKTFYDYNWPGNVREFKNVIESGFNFASSNIIKLKDLPDFINNKNSLEEEYINISSQNSLNIFLEICEKKFILEKSKQIDSLSHLADKLGISRQSLNYKIKKYNLREFL